MKTKHTKGTWAVQENTVLKDGSYVIKSGNTLIGFASDSDTLSKDETEANAKLIAAAPELLEALKRANATMKLLKGTNKLHKDDLLLVAIERAESAIKKATE